jgi:elongation factor Ts
MSIDLIKKIREATGLPLKDIKKAVDEFGSDSEEKIIDHLRKQGILKKDARSDRQTDNGRVFAYVHEGRIGVMLELKCETDFVARSDSFIELGNDLGLHIAAYRPMYVSPDQAPMEYIEKELEISRSQLVLDGKSSEMIEKILVGKKTKILEENAALKQQFLKNPNITIEERITEVSIVTGEKIEFTKFVIYVLS